MSKIKFPIRREDIFASYVYLLDRELEVQKKRLAIIEADYNSPCTSQIRDIYYETPAYKVIPSMFYKKDFFPFLKENRNESEIVIGDLIQLYPLLKKTGFSYELSPRDLIFVQDNLLNGVFAYNHCDLFGYQRKSDWKWKNGLIVPNTEIQELSDYDIRKYELIDEENELAQLFPLLNEVDYRNPEAIFTPFEEEGQIRKRILQGCDKIE